MDQQFYKSFNAKILLFGEHIVLHGAKALAIPLKSYSMEFQHTAEVKLSDEVFEFFLQYLLSNKDFKLVELYNRIVIEEYKSSIKSGLKINSTIPMNAGLGSSGAFIALFYEYFCKEKKHEISALKKDLALLESAFHGASSGIDPLVIYLGNAILMQQDHLESINHSNIIVPLFCFNSNIKRNTQDCIRLFNNKLNDQEFKKNLNEKFIPMSNQIIENYLELKEIGFLFKQISMFQFEYMKEFIPESIMIYWKQGLENNTYYLKLCGAGCGGFFLGYSVTEYPKNSQYLLLK